MAIKPSVDQFLSILCRSGLIPSEQISGLVDLFASRGVDVADSLILAEAFIAEGLISQWQADKLIQGKHRGFFLGKYRLTALLGTGGMSSVYLAEHVMMRRKCAIKVLPAKKAKDTSYLARFQREAQAVASLDHPNIVRAYDVDKDFDKASEIHFLVMEHVDGQSLQEMIEADGPFDFTLAADSIRQAADGLAHAHAAGLVHRDVKPSNLLLNKSGTLKILDLGLARFFAEDDKDSLTVAHDEKVLGTADYLAPEQALDSHNVDSRADIYALGCTFYYLMLGHPPYTEGTLAQRLMAHQTKAPPAIEKSRADAPPYLVDLIRKMMIRDPDQRIATASDVSELIVAWLVAEGDERWKQSHSSLIGSSLKLNPNDPDLPPASGDQQRKINVAPEISVSSKSENNELSSFLSNLAINDTVNGQPTNLVLKQPEVQENLQVDTRLETPQLKQKTVSTAPEIFPSKQKQSRVPEITEDHTPEDDEAEDNSQSELALVDKMLIPIRKIYDKLGLYNSILMVVTLFSLGAIIASQMPSRAEDGSSESGEGNLSRNGGNSRTKKGSSKKNRSAVRVLKVGPNAEYQTIASALKYAKEEFNPQSIREVLTIEVEGGRTYKESLVIDNSQSAFGDHRILIVSKGNTPALLQAADTQPVVKIIAAHYITLEGFEIDCAGKSTGVELTGFCTGTRLQNLKIRDFSANGIVGKSLQGFASANSEVSFEDIRFLAKTPSAVGFRFHGDTSRVSIHNCLFQGSFYSGVEFKKGAIYTRITQCRFAGLRLGIRFDWTRKYVLKDLEISHNTFYRLQHALHWGQMPDDDSDSLHIAANLFVESKGPDAVVVSGYQANKFRSFAALAPSSRGKPYGFRKNWTSRPTGTAGELILLFQHDGRRSVQSQFRSTKITDDAFLLPTEKSPHQDVGANLLGTTKS